MKSLSSPLLAQKAAAQTASCFAVYIGSTTPIRICNWDVDITLDSNTYSSGVPIGRVSVRNEITGTIKIGNVDDTFTSLVINGSLKKKDIEVYEVFFDDSSTVVGYETLFSGAIDGQMLGDHWCTLTLVPAHDGSVVLCPRRRVVPSCGFVFKGDDCGYSGSETSCAKTFDGCRNSGSPFGGFSFVLKPGKIFTWGSTIIKVE